LKENECAKEDLNTAIGRKFGISGKYMRVETGSTYSWKPPCPGDHPRPESGKFPGIKKGLADYTHKPQKKRCSTSYKRCSL